MFRARTLCLSSSVFAMLTLLPAAVAANECYIRLEGVSIHDNDFDALDMKCKEYAKVRIDGGLLLISPQCNFVPDNDPDGTNPSNLVLSNFDLVKIGPSTIGDPDNWDISEDRATGVLVYTCKPNY